MRLDALDLKSFFLTVPLMVGLITIALIMKMLVSSVKVSKMLILILILILILTFILILIFLYFS